MDAFLGLLLPPHCPGCGQEGVVLCHDCRLPLDRRLEEPPGAPLGMPVSLPDGLLQFEWCATYSGPVRQAIHALKYRGERRLVAPLAASLAERWATSAVGGDLLTWVPVHPDRRRERGFDQAELLARAMARRLRMPVCACLERNRRTVAQHALGQRARAENVGGVFAVASGTRHEVLDHWIVVVDDVMTTGATLSGCARALLEAGARGVSAITVARDR
jgi:competence protein ComFC